jgi:hypothetical protein
VQRKDEAIAMLERGGLVDGFKECVHVDSAPIVNTIIRRRVAWLGCPECTRVALEADHFGVLEP